jgi:hypothetical protein
MIKKNVIIVQRAYRKFMIRRDKVKERMKDYLTQEFTIGQNVREMEEYQLFGEDDDPDLVKTHSPYGIKKIFLFNRCADMQVICDLSDMYPTPWASQMMRIYKDQMAAEKPVMQMQVGGSHSVAATGRGILFSWGWNDNG